MGFAFAVAAFCLGGRPADAQSTAVKYWNPGWLGFGGNLNAGQARQTDGSLPGLEARHRRLFRDAQQFYRAACLSAMNAAPWASA